MITALSFLLSLAYAGSDALDGVGGWGSHTWGSAPTAELEAVGKTGEVTYYAMPEGDRAFFDVPVQQVMLGYQEDRLVAFRFDIPKRAAKEMKGIFGAPGRSSGSEKFWFGEGIKLTASRDTATFSSTRDLGVGTAVHDDVARDGSTTRGSLGYLDTRPGWRDLAWGSAPANGMEKVDGDPMGEAYYIRDSDKLAAGDYPLASIGYGYFRSQLFSVMLILPDYASYRGVRSGLEEAYGQPSAAEGDRLAWRGERIDLSLTFDPESEQGAVIYFYVPVRDELDAAEAEAAERAADDL